jgi:subtilisin-like proprotein convertase family protein
MSARVTFGPFVLRGEHLARGPSPDWSPSRFIRHMSLAAGVALVGALFVDPSLAAVESFTDGSAAEAGPILDPANRGSISLPDKSVASPYPSVANSQCTGTITDVDVTLYGVTHPFSDDIDIVLQAPGGQSTKIMSDAGGANSVDTTLTFDDEASTPLPDSDPIDRGPGALGAVHKPTNYFIFDSMPAPSPEPISASLAVFDGTSPGGDWKLFVRDDDPPPECVACVPHAAGSIQGGWALTLTLTTPTGVKRVCIPQAGMGEPYPSDQLVSGLAGAIQDVNVFLTGLSHTWPDDLDVTVQGPVGQSAMLMSDVGGGNDVNGLDLTLDDEATAELPNTGQLVNGTFKPTNISIDDVMPAPAGPYTPTLDVFDGTNANGPWSLFVNDDAPGDKGFLAGWSLQITTPQGTVTIAPAEVPAPAPTAPTPTCPGFENDPRKHVVGTVGPDTLVGTPEKDVVCGLGGDDKLSGIGGNDLILGGSGKDTLRGNKGRDTLKGGPGPDKLFGGPGSDRCRGGPGDDSFSGCER